MSSCHTSRSLHHILKFHPVHLSLLLFSQPAKRLRCVFWSAAFRYFDCTFNRGFPCSVPHIVWTNFAPVHRHSTICIFVKYFPVPVALCKKLHTIHFPWPNTSSIWMIGSNRQHITRFHPTMHLCNRFHNLALRCRFHLCVVYR